MSQPLKYNSKQQLDDVHGVPRCNLSRVDINLQPDGIVPVNRFEPDNSKMQGETVWHKPKHIFDQEVLLLTKVTLYQRSELVQFQRYCPCQTVKPCDILVYIQNWTVKRQMRRIIF